MAGYNYSKGMSNNAANAYNNDIVPKSSITRKLLDKYGIKLSVKVVKELISNNLIQPSEWHHSGGTWYNEVDFYSLENITNRIDELKEDGYDFTKTSQTLNSEECYVKGSYSVFNRSRRRTVYVGEEDFVGIKKGNWIFFKNTKKKASGNHINYEIIKRSEYKKLIS